jgi:hypothetical protein
MLVACSSVPEAPQPEYLNPSPPTEKAIVANVLGVAKAAKMTDPLEISDVRPTNFGPGRYFVCLREANPPPNKPPRYYSVFFDNDAYKGDRMSAIMEKCETQAYRPLPAPAPAAVPSNAKINTHH